MEQPAASDRIEELLAHRAWVQRVARALVLDDNRADDLEQETWLRALSSPAPRSPRAWLGTVLRNAATNMRIAERRRVAHETSAPPQRLPSSPEDLLERAEIVERVARAVRTLEEPYRSAILLRYFEDLSPPAIAAQLGVPLETVRTRLRRGLARLREQLDRDERGDRRRCSLLLLPLARWPEPEATGSTLVAGTTGAVLMTIKTKVAIATAVALLLTGLAWVPRTEDRHVPVPQPPEVATERPEPAPLPVVIQPLPEVAAFTIQGMVMDGSTGRTLAGARVQAVRPATSEVESESVADAGGRFTLAVKDDAPVMVKAWKDLYEPLERMAVKPGAYLTLRMLNLGAVIVRVKDTRQDSVAGANVTLLGEDRKTRSAVTDVEGRAVFEGQAPGRFMVGATPPDGRTELAQASQSAVLLAGERQEVHLDMGPGISCAGQVVDAESGVPIAGARILSVFGPRYREWLANSDGRFSYDWFWADRPTWGAGVLVRAPGYESLDFKFKPASDREFVVPLRSGISRRFRAIAPDGQPVPGARVVVYGMRVSPYEPVGESWTDASGECSVGGISPEEKFAYLVCVTSPDGLLRGSVEKREGYPGGMKDEESLRGFISIPLVDCVGRLSLRLRSGQDPVEGRRVRIGWIPTGREYAFQPRRGGPPERPDVRTTLPKECIFESDSDPAGHVAFTGTPGGAYAVEVEGREDRGWFVAGITGASELDIDLDEALPDTHEVRGTVRTEGGPISQAFVHLVSETGAFGDGSITGVSGRFRIRTYRWPPARIVVGVRESGGTYRQIEFPAPEEGEEVDLLVVERTWSLDTVSTR